MERSGTHARRIVKRGLFYAGALLLALLLTALILELGMAALGWLYYRPASPAAEDLTLEDADKAHILCLGDSHTYGLGAPAGLDYPSQLQRILNQRAGTSRFAAINLGCPADNTSQDLHNLEEALEGLPVKIDVAVICSGTNNTHSLRDATILPERVRELSLRDKLDYMLGDSAAYRLTKLAQRRLRALASQNQEDPGALITSWSEPFLYDWALRDYTAMAERCAERRVPLVLMSYWFRIDFVDRAMREAAQRPGVYYLDQRLPTAGAYLTYGGALVAEDRFHPNERGYYRIASRLADFLVDQGLARLER